MSRLLLLFFFILISSQCVFAEKIPVKITPAQIISTHNDEIQVGDWIKFKIANDIYANDKVYLKKGTPIYGFVDFFHPNGWLRDSAEIKFEKFKTIDSSNQKIEILYPFVMNEKLVKSQDIKQICAQAVVTIIRGHELYVEPETQTYNIFITR